MSERQWTPEQRDAIQARGGTLLVSAAAGSGKTAVLVERVVSRMLDQEHPVDADRMLIVTFSNAAAAEMKQRLMARVTQLLEANPESQQLQRQQLLLGRAQISTIHAFCLELIRSNFQKLGIPSNIRAADEKELELLRMDCAGQVVERFHQEDEDGRFGQLVELLSTGRDDRRLFQTLFQMYDFLLAHPFYQQWLGEKLELYDSHLPVEQSVWGTVILEYAQGAVSHALKLTQRSLELVLGEEALEKAYLDPLTGDQLQLEQLLCLLKEGDWDKVCQKLDAVQFQRLGACRGEDPRKEQVKALREQVKKLLTSLREEQFCATAQEFREDIAFLRPLVEKLFQLVEAFDQTFTQTKQQRALMDFSDMEHYAIQLLAEPDGKGWKKTQLAQSVAQQYEEILVDECQDINAAQDILFRAVSQKERNLFMVGDVKQSIYRFRQAMPELFLKRKKEYAPYDGKTFPAKVVLGKNFRSASDITEGVNFFFSLLMSEKLGEIRYTQEEALVPGAQFPPESQSGVELDLLDFSQYAGEKDKSALEAQHVAERVAGLLESGVLVTDQGRLRKITPGDICVLMRSPSNKAKLYLDAMAQRGIPVWAEPKSSYLTTREVAPVLSLLRVVENPLLDIDLAAAMVSALFRFSPDQLARIRLVDRKVPLYLAVERMAQEGDEPCAQFLGILKELRTFASSASADQVIRRVYDLTDYMGKVQVMPMGEARRANLLLLVQYARDYHANGYKGLSGFVGFLDRLMERGSDLTPASGLSERADVVRIMSIHRSKGLEFPVVILCDCAKPFNKEDLRGNTLLHSQLGFACVRRDLELLRQYTTLPMEALKLELERGMLSEELRVLYVALTRAKERLILTGVSQSGNSVKDAPSKLAALMSPLEEGRLSPYTVRGASSYMDWLLMAALHHPKAQALLSQWGMESQVKPTEGAFDLRVYTIMDDLPTDEALEQARQVPPDQDFLGQLESRMGFQYPYQAQTRVPTKLGVSQISKEDLSKAYRFARRPAFLQKGGLTAAQKGNALHKFMQFSDYKQAAQNPQKEIARMEQKGFLTGPEAAAVDAKRVKTFFESPLAKRIFSAQKVYRELRFLAEVGRETIGAYTDLITDDSKTAIQGVADCVFVEDGQAVIVDYKTDHVKSPQELIDRYRIQLELYRRVLGDSLGLPVKECVIYSFALSQEIQV